MLASLNIIAAIFALGNARPLNHCLTLDRSTPSASARADLVLCRAIKTPRAAIARALVSGSARGPGCFLSSPLFIFTYFRGVPAHRTGALHLLRGPGVRVKAFLYFHFEIAMGAIHSAPPSAPSSVGKSPASASNVSKGGRSPPWPADWLNWLAIFVCAAWLSTSIVSPSS